MELVPVESGLRLGSRTNTLNEEKAGQVSCECEGMILGHDDDIRLGRASAQSVNHLSVADLKPTRKVLTQEAPEDFLLNALPLAPSVVKRRPYLRKLATHLVFDGGNLGLQHCGSLLACLNARHEPTTKEVG